MRKTQACVAQGRVRLVFCSRNGAVDALNGVLGWQASKSEHHVGLMLSVDSSLRPQLLQSHLRILAAAAAQPSLRVQEIYLSAIQAWLTFRRIMDDMAHLLDWVPCLEDRKSVV